MEINEKRVNLHIRNFEKALAGYQYNEPFSRYLTRFFKENKQMGSSDRRMTSRFCYNYFRLGNAFRSKDAIDRLVFAEFLCEDDSPLVWYLNPLLAGSLTLSLHDKFQLLTKEYDFQLQSLFPLVEHFSTTLPTDEFIGSQFIQPDLFLRIKRGKEDFVRNTFAKNEIVYQDITAQTLALANGTNLQKVVNLEGKYEVQDLSSQRTINFMAAKDNENWWDACAASGGKALMFLDKYPMSKLLVSDVRMSILRNLDERFEKSGISIPYRKKVLDLTQSVNHILQDEKFDGIILDTPCSGSGTWGRTPEMIQQFDEEKLKEYSSLQKQIVRNVIPHLKKGGSLIYITCSIYRDENEDIVDYILENYPLRVEKMALLTGFKDKADSMFAARFIKD